MYGLFEIYGVSLYVKTSASQKKRVSRHKTSLYL